MRDRRERREWKRLRARMMGVGEAVSDREVLLTVLAPPARRLGGDGLEGAVAVGGDGREGSR